MKLEERKKYLIFKVDYEKVYDSINLRSST